jgi:uncharacterized protein
VRTLLQLQELDLQIETCKAREVEIPKQKKKYEQYRDRLKQELAQREEAVKRLQLEQREAETDIEQRQAQITKFNIQLNSVKKNEEYQALLHEIDGAKKQIGLKEERILTIMEQIEDAQARLKEDRKRIEEELKDIDKQFAAIDEELADAVKHREALQDQGKPLIDKVDDELLMKYNRIRKSKNGGAAVVPLNDEVCGGCHMYLRPQIVNEVLAGEKVHTCQHCGRLLYHRENFEDENVGAEQQSN